MSFYSLLISIFSYFAGECTEYVRLSWLIFGSDQLGSSEVDLLKFGIVGCWLGAAICYRLVKLIDLHPKQYVLYMNLSYCLISRRKL